MNNKRSKVNNMKLVVLLMMVFRPFGFSGACPVRTIPLDQLMKPGSILVLDNRCYISQKGCILTFDLEQGKLINNFGSRGSGPGEFMGVIRIHESKGRVMVSSQNKVSLFTPEGKLIREMVPTGGGTATVSGFQPLNSGFVGAASVLYKKTLYRSVCLYDGDLKFVKELYRSPVGSPLNASGGKNDFFRKAFSYRASGDRVFIAGSSGFRIHVFSGGGNLLKKISRPFDPIPFTPTDRRNFLLYLKENSPSYVFRDMARRIVFPDCFPVIFFIFSDGDTLYIFTWGKNRVGLETFLYCMDGKFLGKQYIPVHFSNPVMFSPFTIKSGKMYQLVEDEETETWVLEISQVR